MTNDKVIHLGRKLDPSTLDSLADIICGDDTAKYPKYRSSTWLTRLFQDAGIDVTHDGSTRKWWVLDILEQLQPSDLEKIILRLNDIREYKGDRELVKQAIEVTNIALSMDGIKVGYENNKPVLRFAKPINIEDELSANVSNNDEADFLNKQFSDHIEISKLNLDATLTEYLQERISEVQNCPKDKIALGTIFLLGSTLEGILLAVALKNPAKFMSAKSKPLDKNGKVLKLYDWKLNNLIDTAYELQLISLDVKKFSHILRDFRNFIHPYHQMSQNFKPDQNTVNICWQVFKAAIDQLENSNRVI